MRKILLACFTFLIFGVSYSQKYQPVDSTTVWNSQNYWRISSGTCCYVNEFASFQFHGFELNNGNTWLKLYESAAYSRVACSTPCNDGIVPGNFTNAFVGYVLNDSLNKKVYFTTTLTANYTPTTTNIVYDFLNKNVGDSLVWKSVTNSGLPGGPTKFKILAIDSFLFATKYHKRFKVVNNSVLQLSSGVVYVVEGIGSTLGAWNSIFADFESKSELKCFSKPSDAVSITNYTTFATASAAACGTISALPEFKPAIISVYPNPVNNSITFENIEVNSLSIYDALGKLVMQRETVQGPLSVESLLPGIYFLKMRSNNTVYSSRFIKE
ncbi:MAG: T9SS type A sorting domain-containing protein [Bacteroidia bacterium]|nr:T9SS type A sorting domain-containing protein [Bacteroidia bacterium]